MSWNSLKPQRVHLLWKDIIPKPLNKGKLFLILIEMALRRILLERPLLEGPLRRRLFANPSNPPVQETPSGVRQESSVELETKPETKSSPATKKSISTLPIEKTEPAKPDSGKSFSGQSDEAYCHECIEAHIMNAKTELRHALDRFRTSKEMSPGVVEKVRVAIQELQGINEDVKNTRDVDPQIKKGLDGILDEVRWIRKEFGVSGRGLTRGLGTQKDLEELRDRVDKLQDVSYDLADDCPSCSEAVGLGWSLNLAKQLNMPNADQLVKDVEDEKVSTEEALSQIVTFAQEKGTKEDVESLQEIKRLMYTPLKELEKEKV